MVLPARLLLGLIFLVFGLNGFHIFIPVPRFHSPCADAGGECYIHLVKTVEVIAGALLLVNRAILLALVLLGADIANIVACHSLPDQRNWPVGGRGVLYLIVVAGYWAQVKLLFRWRVR